MCGNADVLVGYVTIAVYRDLSSDSFKGLPKC